MSKLSSITALALHMIALAVLLATQNAHAQIKLLEDKDLAKTDLAECVDQKSAIVWPVQSAGTPMERLPPPLRSADGQPPLTLDEVTQIALNHNPTLSEFAARIGAAQGLWLQAGLRPNPTIGYTGEDMGALGTAGQQGGFVAKEFVTGGKLGLNRAVAQTDVQAAQQQWVAQRMRVVSDVRAAFYEVIITQREWELNERLATLARKTRETEEQRVKALESSRAALISSELQELDLQMQLQGAQRRYSDAWRRLIFILGRPNIEPTPLIADVEAIPDIGWTEALRRLLQNSPELAQAATALDRARWVWRRARAQRVPNVNVRASVRHNDEIDDTVTDVAVSLPLPVLDRNQGNVRAACFEITVARCRLQRTEFRLRTKLAQLIRRYEIARYQAERYADTILPKSQASLELIQNAYLADELEYLDFLTAQSTYSHNSLAYIAALREVWDSYVAIDGLLLTGSLADRAGAR